MEKIFFSTFILLMIQCTSAQSDLTNERTGEFVIYDNGLIYDKATMSKLRKMVDSLNLRFKKCESKNYYSLEQGYGSYISIRKNVQQAREALLQNMKFEDFLKKFQQAEVKKNLWIVKEHITYDGIQTIEYNSAGTEQLHISVPDALPYDKTKGWIYEDHDDNIDILFLHELKTSIIPVEYGRLIQYVDCMVDTMATIFPKDERPDSLTYLLVPGSKAKEFIDLATDFESEPGKPEVDINDPRSKVIYEQHEIAVKEWDSRRIAALDKKMKEQNNIRLLNEAVDESIIDQNGFYLDYYAQRYLSAGRALELKRSFRVRGSCSADTGPRDHARSICKLAAEDCQWDIFLRAHLDILNDNFERTSDGAWAKSRRETYTKELEELDINTVDLLIGTTLNSKNVSNNHYQARTSRIGRAFTESKYKAEIENILISMTEDERLDLYNRMEMAYVFIFYNRKLKDKQAYVSNLTRIKKAIATLPDDLHKRYSPLIND